MQSRSLPQGGVLKHVLTARRHKQQAREWQGRGWVGDAPERAAGAANWTLREFATRLGLDLQSWGDAA
eukprot:922363-Alexandrium_andersonii.AAC.1